MKILIRLLLCATTCLLFNVNVPAQVTKTLNGTVRYESGKSTSTLQTSNGNVVVSLPQLSGAMITGTVSAEPAGKTEKEKSRNLKELLKLVVMLDGQKIPLSATPSTFDWITHPDLQLRTPMELLNISGMKVAELSLPPVLPAASVNSGNNQHLTTPSNILVQGGGLNVYTDHQFSPGQKFLLTDSKGQQFTINPVCLSSQQAVMNVPAGASPGICTVSGVFMGNAQVTPARFTLLGMDIRSPNTNLRPGQLSNVLVTVTGGMSDPTPDIGSNVYFNIDPKITDKDSAEAMQIPIRFCVDLRNLTPTIVTMEGGNLQRIYPSDKTSLPEVNLPNDGLPTHFEIRRNITGNAVGSFSVNASLHEDFNTSHDPFRPQLNVLNSAEEFNAWANALKKDLKVYATAQINDAAGAVAFEALNINRAIDHMPVCEGDGQLDECKAVAYSLLQPLHVPKGAAISWLSSFEAGKTAGKAIDNNLAGHNTLIDYDVLKNVTAFMNRIGEWLKDPALQTESTQVLQLINEIQMTTETKENLQDLKDKMNVLIAKAGLKIETGEAIILKAGMKDINSSSLQLPSIAGPGQVHPVNDLIGFLDPNKKVLRVKPEYQQQILNSLNAVSLNNGRYHINAISASRTPVAYNIQLMPLVMADIGLLDDLAERLIEDMKKDPGKGTIITTLVDSTGTWYVFFKDSKCVEFSEEKTSCSPDYTYEEKDGKTVGTPTGSYIKKTHKAGGSCKKGTGFCTEVLMESGNKYICQDANCNLCILIRPYYRFSCL